MEDKQRQDIAKARMSVGFDKAFEPFVSAPGTQTTPEQRTAHAAEYAAHQLWHIRQALTTES